MLLLWLLNERLSVAGSANPIDLYIQCYMRLYNDSVSSPIRFSDLSIPAKFASNRKHIISFTFCSARLPCTFTIFSICRYTYRYMHMGGVYIYNIMHTHRNV